MVIAQNDGMCSLILHEFCSSAVISLFPKPLWGKPGFFG
jgi:hypothetical protein